MKWQFVLLYAGFVSAVCIVSCRAQEAGEGTAIKEFTIMEHFAPELVIPVEQRRRLKMERREEVIERKGVINQLDIPERKKRRLLRELNSGPFTDQYERVLGSLEEEDRQDLNPD